MRKIINIILLAQLYVYAGFFTNYGFIKISTLEGVGIHIDGEYKGNAGNGETKIKVSEGNHKIKIYAETKDGEWYYTNEKTIYVGDGVEISTQLLPNKYPTKKRLERLRQLEIEEKNKQRLIAQKKLNTAKKYGFTTINEYEQFKKNIDSLKNNLEKNKLELNKTKEKLQQSLKVKEQIKFNKNNIFTVQNEVMDIKELKQSKNKIKLNIFNNYTKMTLKPSTDIELEIIIYDNKYNKIDSFQLYKDGYNYTYEKIIIQPKSSKWFNMKTRSQDISKYNMNNSYYKVFNLSLINRGNQGGAPSNKRFYDKDDIQRTMKQISNIANYERTIKDLELSIKKLSTKIEKGNTRLNL